MKCKRCGIETARLFATQRYCPQCEREVRHRIRQDAERQHKARWHVKDFTGTTPL